MKSVYENRTAQIAAVAAAIPSTKIGIMFSRRQCPRLSTERNRLSPHREFHDEGNDCVCDENPNRNPDSCNREILRKALLDNQHHIPEVARLERTPECGG